MSQQPKSDNMGKCAPPPNSERVEYKDLDSAQKEVTLIMRTMKRDATLMGISQLGLDGIYRSLTADREVVDAVPLTPALIKAMLDRIPYNEEREKLFCGVDGNKTAQEQWYKPLAGILPPPLEEKYRNVSEEELEENKRWYYEERKKLETEGVGKDAVYLMSDHDLGPGAGKRKLDESG
ncbi:hypothetical protein ACHAPQ_011690 [Fusarium lateritium]